MPPRQICKLLLAATALCAVNPAQAQLSLRYDGRADFQFYTSNSREPPGALRGEQDYTARFYYDDLGTQVAAALYVNDALVEFYDFCDDLPGNCAPLEISAISVGSITGSTPENYMTIGVISPGAFGGLPLIGPGRRIYDLVAEDESIAFLAFSLFDDQTGFAYNDAVGTVSRVTTAVPEPQSWAMLIGGFGLTGAMLRRRRRPVSA